MKERQQHILLCDDDVNMVSVLAEYLREKGYEVQTALDASESLEKASNNLYDICLIDTRLYVDDECSLITALREQDRQLAIIALTKHASQEDIIRAYNNGCDDCLEKPLAVEVLMCKIRALLRRTQELKAPLQTQFQFGDMMFDSIHQTLNGQLLSARESDILLMLCNNAGQLVDKHVILRSLWKEDNQFTARSLNVYITRLRHYLADTDLQIVGVRKRGFKLINNKSKE